MSLFCDVALPVPLDRTFTYSVDGTKPVVGGRVLVPFRNVRMSGVVTALHDQKPEVATKKILKVLDEQPVLDGELRDLAEWMAQYYIAPLGEVYRTMLPLGGEFRRVRTLRITAAGMAALHDSASKGARTRTSEQDTLAEFRVLDYLASRAAAREETVRASNKTSRTVLGRLIRRKWITAEDVSSAEDATPMVRIAVLQQADGRLNHNQRQIVETLAASGGRARVDALRTLDVPAGTLGTLVRRAVVAIQQEVEDLTIASVPPQGSEFELNQDQGAALAQIQIAVKEGTFSVTLLHGVTGSGKTAVYLAAMQQVLANGRSAILLVPEIGLTPAAAANLYRVFGADVAVLHSALSAGERAHQWRRIRQGEAKMVVGTRSAVFAPVTDLALIVVDEEHDASYKQEETPRYHGRDVAVMRGKIAKAAVVLGSATPSLESFHNAAIGKYRLIGLKERVERRPLPEVEIVDMRQEFEQTGEEKVFSRRLVEEIEQRLSRREQAMLLMNRRGYSSVVLCRACGQTVQCRNCAIALTHHKRDQKLECHYCGYRERVPEKCPKCGSDYVYFLGSGSEKLEHLLHASFPAARIGRLDRDTVRGRGDFERVLNALHAGEIDLLVGTQMIAKGHDVHGVTLVGVVGADFALGFPDFRAAERTFQLLTQVAGRAGRGETPGKVVLQTWYPEHYAIQFAASHDYAGFQEKELRYRRWMHYPPFTALANVLVRSGSLEEALRWSGLIGQWFKTTQLEGIRVLGPAAAPIVRLKRDYRYHFVLKSPSRQKLNTALRAMLEHAAERRVPRVNVIVDVDALSLL